MRAMARRQGLLAAAMVTPIAVGLIIFAWFGVPVVLPTYTAAAPAVAALSIGFVALAYLTGYGNYLNVVGRQWHYLIAQLVGVTVGVALMFVGGRLAGLVGIALGMAASHLVYGALLRAVAQRTDAESEAAFPPDR